jgi:hypothetical protein
MSIDEDTNKPMWLEGCMKTNLREAGLNDTTICGCMKKDLCNYSPSFGQSIVLIFIVILFLTFI